jgi:hypothetical protein
VKLRLAYMLSRIFDKLSVQADHAAWVVAEWAFDVDRRTEEDDRAEQ